jgi:hypothetical protein
VPRGLGWRPRYSMGIVCAESGDVEGDAWVDALLDSGSADEVIVTSSVDLQRVVMNSLQGPMRTASMVFTGWPDAQVLVVALRELPTTLLPALPSSGAGVHHLLGTEREALTGTQVRDVADTWSHAVMQFFSGHPQLAGVAVAAPGVDAGAPTPANRPEPIKDTPSTTDTAPAVVHSPAPVRLPTPLASVAPSPSVPDATKSLASLHLSEELAQSLLILERMDSAQLALLRQWEVAREQHDLVRMDCLSGKSTSFSAKLDRAREARKAFATAAQRADVDVADHEFTILNDLRREGDQLAAEANQCPGTAP